MPPLVHHPDYCAALPADHAMPIGKYQSLVEQIRSADLCPRGFIRPEPADAALLLQAHDPDYVHAILSLSASAAVQRRIGLPLGPELVRRALAVCGGTLLTARLARLEGLACNTAGGSHHAARAYGSGFCIFNDVAVAAAALLSEEPSLSLLVVDLDVHQGDGTALIFEHEPRVFTFSLHAEKNFPVVKARSDLDVGLPDGADDEAYLGSLSDQLPNLLRRLRPNLVFYIAGVDPHREDRLGRLSLSDEGLERRERFVLEACRDAGAPVAAVLGGGYDRRAEQVAARHLLLFKAAALVSGRTARRGDGTIDPSRQPAASL